MAERRRVVKLGVVGCGAVTETLHLPTLRNVAGARVVAVADVDLDRARRVANRFNIGRYYDHADALLEDPEVEAVAVCVPARFHADVALAALAAGRHALIEKPLALTLEEAGRLCTRAEAFRGAVLMGFNMRWHRLVRRAREVIREGRLGPLELMRTAFTSAYDLAPEWRTRRELGGGVLFELGVHHFDLWRFLLATEVDEVLAVSRSGECEDETVTVMARLANGVLVASVFSERTGAVNELDISGRAGRLTVSCYDFDGLAFTPSNSSPGGASVRLGRIAHSLREMPAGAARMRRGGDFFLSYEGQWRHFLDAVRGDVAVECSTHDGRRALEIALAAAASASLGRPVKVGDATGAVEAPAHGTATGATGPGPGGGS